MPQTNLYFFDSIGLGVVFFWVVGYALFYRFFVGRIMLVYKTRDYLQQLGVSAFFCPTSLVGDVTYLETFLFSIEFGLLLGILVGLAQGQTFKPDSKINFNLVPVANTARVRQQVLTQEAREVVSLFGVQRQFLFYSISQLNLVTLQVLNQVFIPYQSSSLLLAVYQSLKRQPVTSETTFDE